MMWLITAVPKCPNPDCVEHDETMEIDVPESDMSV
jgi:hypothetical protein